MNWSKATPGDIFCPEQFEAVQKLHTAVTEQLDKRDNEGADTDKERTVGTEVLDELLWCAVFAFQDYPFYTSSGLSFSYHVKRKRNGEYSGELLVSRKESSKTLTKSSVLLAFHRVLEDISVVEKSGERALLLNEYKGPKAIGQIFGVSYVYSLFWRLGLIKVPEKVEEKLRGESAYRKCI